jgi:hypothetical protein
MATSIASPPLPLLPAAASVTPSISCRSERESREMSNYKIGYAHTLEKAKAIAERHIAKSG